jgi:YrbI family 3-deoxy-D-manno-octulosonate 8-phosphate phosphatase
VTGRHAQSDRARVVTVIPARGGSKGVPRKNLAPVGGVPLVARAVAAALASGLVDTVLVSTDDAEIAAVAREHGARVVERPAALSTDGATSESAVLHALDTLDTLPDAVVLVQATSPFIDPEALGRAVRRVLDGSDDVVFSARETYGFLWRPTPDGAVGVNHDHSSRPRRQDREPHFEETGAFYAMDAAGFRRGGFRFFGRIGFEVTAESAALEIDTPEQLRLAEAIAPLLDPPAPGAIDGDAIDVDAIVTDFDGVHTDDHAHIDEHGDERVTVSRSDGMGVRLLREAGIPVLILSTERHPVVAARAAKLRVEVLHGVDDKSAALVGWAHDRGIPLSRIAYLGNDVNDLGPLSLVGWPVVVPEAHPRALAAARVVLDHRGGHGAVRELAERVLQTRTPPTEGAP